MFRNRNSVVWGMSPMLLLIGLLYQVATFSNPHWLENDECYIGLWKSGCPPDLWSNASASSVLSQALDVISTWRLATQVLQCFAVFCAAICLISAILRLIRGITLWQSLAAIFACLCGVFSTVSCIVFALSQPRPASFALSWAFVLNAVSGCLCLISSLILYLDVRWNSLL